MTWLVPLLAGLAAALATSGARLPRAPSPVAATAGGGDGDGWLVRGRMLWCLLAGAGAVVVVGGPLGWLGAPVAAVGCWVAIGRAESPALVRERAAVRADLPALVRLLAAALATGSAPEEALVAVAAALPGPAAQRLAPVAARLRLGMEPGEAWRALTAVPGLAPLGRALARAQTSGTPVAVVVERLGEELARAARADAEERARQVGVKAAVPLGLCLLPAFLLIGIVPLVGGLLDGLL
jgi:Flp pilus assembly protein TadB